MRLSCDHLIRSNLTGKGLHTAIFLLSTLRLTAQTTLHGTITDAASGAPLPRVAVYVPELHAGASTDSSGSYSLRLPTAGRFVVQFTRLGLESQFREVDARSDSLHVNVAMRVSPLELREATVIGTQVDAPRATSRRVEVMGLDEMRDRGSLSVSDAVAKLPGVTQLTTGVGIGKPVIRGLSGNRVQVNTLGQRFDNQQWQDEHGLGLSDLGIERVEVIKGPAALQYGSDAIGGVLNVREERPAEVDRTGQQLHLALMGNTGGGSLSYGIKHSSAKAWWRLAAGADNHGDYASGGDVRVVNSRFAMYNAKASAGFTRGRWVSANHVHLSLGQFGFVFDTLDRTTGDARYSRSFDGPHHTVAFGIIGSENTIYLPRARWKINAGWHSNKRQEQEGGNKISLDMLLNTASLLTQVTLPQGERGEWTNGVSLLRQTNTNLGSRIIIPDATTGEAAVFSYYRQRLAGAVLEGGLRVDERRITTHATKTLNPPGSVAEPFDRAWTVVNGSLGLAWDPVEPLNIKVNVSSGYRSPNLAELGSNGLHEGTSRFEIGDPDLDVEQNICGEAGFTWEWNEQLEIGATMYHDQFINYIYLARTGEEYIGFPIYRFLQTDALLQGGEATLDLHPKVLHKWDLNASYSSVRAEKSDGSPLPFVPADRLMAALTFTPAQGTWMRATVTHVLEQDRPDQFETATPAYTLLDLSAGHTFAWERQQLRAALFCNNATDEVYADHLSRFKYFNINDIGRNLGLSLQLTF